MDNTYNKSFNVKSRTEKAQKILAVLEDFRSKDFLQETMCVDIGCSSGIITKVLSHHVKKITGIDIDEIAIEFANDNNGGDNIEFMVSDALNLPVEDTSIDIIICNHIYDYVSDQQKLADEISRVLKNRGFCYFAGVNKYVRDKSQHNIKTLYQWELIRLFNEFDIHDYPVKIVHNPRRYHATDVDYWGAILTKIPPRLLKRFLFLFRVGCGY